MTNLMIIRAQTFVEKASENVTYILTFDWLELLLWNMLQISIIFKFILGVDDCSSGKLGATDDNVMSRCVSLCSSLLLVPVRNQIKFLCENCILLICYIFVSLYSLRIPLETNWVTAGKCTLLYQKGCESNQARAWVVLQPAAKASQARARKKRLLETKQHFSFFTSVQKLIGFLCCWPIYMKW